MKDFGEVFMLQQEFQEQLGNDVSSQEFITMNCIALVDETMELLRETPWKPWKKHQEFDILAAREELIDCFHFFINLCISLGINEEDLYDEYMRKHEINRKRQKENY